MERKLKALIELNLFLITFFVMSFFVFIFINGSAFARDLRYSVFLNSPFASEDLRENEIFEVPAVQSSAVATSGIELAQLIIPKINVIAPIAIPRSESNKGVLASLEEGVGLYPGSVEPGVTGRAIILGHSSRATWYRGNYATVFTLLGKLDAPDQFYITKQGKKYVYEVFSKKILTPTETNDVLAGPSVDSEIDLITCFPIGGASKRTLIRGRLVRTENI